MKKQYEIIEGFKMKNLDEYILAKHEDKLLTEREATNLYNEFLDEAYGKVALGPYEYDTSDALKAVDEIAYDEGFKNFLDGQFTEVYDNENKKLFYISDEIRAGIEEEFETDND